MSGEFVFPFPAVIGQEKVKQALILNVINPLIGGVLISGEKGTAKSTLVRGLAAMLPAMDVVELPLNITEDRLVGSLDIEKAVLEGQRSFEPGILMKADGNILYVDEVNLLSEHIVNCLLEVSASGVNHVEREGISACHDSCFVLVGTMNPEEGLLRPQFLDRFGLYVEVNGAADLEERMEIIRRRLEYEKKPEVYRRKWLTENAELMQKITRACKLLALVEVSESDMKLAADIALTGNCAGHRAELVIIETSRALAALAERKQLTEKDIRDAAELALPHRIRQTPAHPEPNQIDENMSDQDNSTQEDLQDDNYEQPNEGSAEEESNGQPENQESQEQKKNSEENSGEDGEDKDDSADDNDNSMDDNSSNNNNQGYDNNEEKIEEPGDVFVVKPIDIQPLEKKKRRGNGKRSRTKTDSLQGRYIRATFPVNKVRDIAFDATVRAAAPYQKSREKKGITLAIEKSDIREKIREKRTGSTILFIVDASGSMGASQRMKAVKGAILSLLNDAYQKRDRVGMVVFRKDSAQLLLDITRSVDLAQKRLVELPTGGKTPLASGLVRGYEILRAAKLKDPEMIPVIVLVSDGRTNVSFNGGNPVGEAVDVARKIAAAGIQTMVIDTEKDFVKLGLASQIAESMKAQYYRIEDLEAGGIACTVRNFV
ncbi:MAG: magnesium chelatase subunit D family protein [Desulfitobacteriaceae bacterium]|nr:magnesium chelatase subunit D family protein [Desulfitobacteriaceae bacterium]MDD4346166.1 magnesium chelatase subunit D family protein [Desulfitobacteriaceae bacterium]MDD4400869.1 magnesium chelatase subunit D family protein [Desulfitobacteriaceae bacterium]